MTEFTPTDRKSPLHSGAIPVRYEAMAANADYTVNFWWMSHDNLVLTARYMVNMGCDADEIADFIEKPWKFEDEYNEAIDQQTGES